jgi:hypothetical protein
VKRVEKEKEEGGETRRMITKDISNAKSELQIVSLIQQPSSLVACP